MLAPKTNLTREAKVAFGVVLNPFGGEVTCEAEMHQSAEFAYCRELAWQTTLTGGFAALVGESGSGKTTLVEDLQERLAAEGKAVKVIKPSVMASEDSEMRGKPMRSAVLLSAIGMELDGSQGLGGNIEQVSRKVRSMLEASTTAGHLHVLVIEEAHALPVATLKHLKRMHEYMRLGRKPMLGILLVGQTELMNKLDPARYDVREVAQRCEVVRLMPLDGDLRAYMATRCKRSGKALDSLFSSDAVDALRSRLTVRSVAAGARGAALVSSMVYPLAVNNLATACLNRAAELGAPLVDRDIVMGV